MSALGDAVASFFESLLELRPIDATYYGRHEHDRRLPEGGREALEREIALVRGLRDRLDELEGDRLERDLARYHCELSLFQLQEQRNWASMPEGADALGTGIFLLFARDFAPLPERLESIACRLEDAPRYLRASRELVSSPVELWVRIALETTRQLPELIGVVVEAAGRPLRQRLQRAGENAIKAIDEHARWIESELLPVARTDSTLGEDRFRRLLQLRLLPDSPDAILELGRRSLNEVKEQRRLLAAAHWPGSSVTEIEARIRSDRLPNFDAALVDYRQCIRDARQFVVDRKLATVPETEVLDVIETPSFLRPVIPFAAYEPAAYFDAQQQGIYLVTPPGDPTQPMERNRADILNTSVHEGYPGHHLQFACANRHPSLARLLAGSHATEFIEGWAHYCEQMMYEQGFSQTPEVRFIQLTDLIWRSCRIIIDVELSRGRLDFETAIAMLVDEAGMKRENAESEVKRYTYTPGYQLSYLYGKHLLLELRERIRRERGGDFSLQDFHDRLLYAGALPAAMWDQLFKNP